MATFPSALPSYLGFTASHTLAADQHASQHNSEQADITAIATKIGTGASTPVNQRLLRGNGTGTSAWGQADLTTDVTGVLPVANGGTGTTSTTGSGSVVFSVAPALTGGGSWGGSPTITTPSITDFTNANHNHSNATGGGQLSGSSALTNSSVTADKVNLLPQKDFIATSESTTSGSFTDLTTPGPVVTATIGVNGQALVNVEAEVANASSGAASQISLSVSGATTIGAAASNSNLPFVNVTHDGTTHPYGHSTCLITGLTPGANTFTMKYISGGGSTSFFLNRRISVIPL